ncbi:MAG: hypothetical protein AVDCRST_MAG48-530, partial [uncultured Friedmanniella sp.]
GEAVRGDGPDAGDALDAADGLLDRLGDVLGHGLGRGARV